MKKITLLLFMLSFTWFSFAQVGLNTITPDASSALDIESTTGGILIPRLSESQRDAIALPATGLMIYQTDKNPGFYFYSGTSWTKINGATGPQGVFGGASFEYKYGGIGPLLSDVDNGLVRFLDSDTQNSAIQLQFSELDINGSSVFSFIEMLSQTQSTTKGVVRLVDKLDSSKNLQFKITNIDFTNATGSSAPGYFIFDVENVASSSSNPFSDFASYTPVVMTYSISGSDGLQGPQGSQGDQGIQGEQGPEGLQGIQGNQGEQGIQGPIGLTGLTGPSGQDGANGINGVDGAQGQTGATGPQGPQGEQGIQGIQGPIGLTGVTGPSGQDGANGIDGGDGPQGQTGATGPQGPQGEQGIQGIQGPIGLTGVTGPSGQDGANGIDGVDGAQGQTGATGPQGIQGEQGIQGAQGPIGVTGPSGQDGANGIDGVDGAQGQTGATGPQGSQGEQGVQGPIGLTGLTGPQGDQGEDSTVPGPSGPQGETGPAGATGVAGPTGPPGSQGAPGNDGIDGENGEDGLSAYEIWINAGNTGSEADFLASLTGPAGADGVDGSFPVANNQGDMLYWDGNEWALIENGQTGNILYFCDGVPKWGPCDGGEDPADPADPQIESESALAYEPNNFVRFNNIPQYDNLSSITVEFWVFKNNHQDEHIIGTEYYDTGWSVNGQTNNSIALLGGLSVPNSSEVFIPLGEWVHIVLQYDGSLSENNIKFFINGEIKYQESGFPDEIGDGGSIAINRHSWNGGVSSRLSGKLDEVRISNIARYSENFTPSTNQLQNDNNTLLLLNFETTSSSSNQVIDSSDFQNHGNVTGEISYTPRN